MTLHRREQDETGVRFIALTAEQEAAARANPATVIGNDSGHDFVLPGAAVADLAAAREAAAAHVAARVPQTVTPRQFRLALDELGLLDGIEAAIANADKATRITWEFAVSIERRHPRMIAMATSLGLLERLDEIFRAAAAIE
jgi:hypothetical protein